MSSLHLHPRNDVLDANPPVANNNITTHGSNLNWAICALHALLLLVAIVYTYLTPWRRRIFNYFAISILTVTTIYYFILASNLGSKAVPVEFSHEGVESRTRQVFYARWVGYFINFSLVYLALALMSKVAWMEVWFIVGLTMAWATMLLVGELVRNSYKWGFFVFAVVLWGLLGWQVLGVARRHARSAAGGEGYKSFMTLAGWEWFLMMLYLISWGLSEGGNKITNDAEQIFYAVLDVLSQGVFAVLLMLMGRKLDLARLRLEAKEEGRVGRALDEEKRAHGSNGYHNGTRNDNGNGRQNDAEGRV